MYPTFLTPNSCNSWNSCEKFHMNFMWNVFTCIPHVFFECEFHSKMTLCGIHMKNLFEIHVSCLAILPAFAVGMILCVLKLYLSQNKAFC